jgi:dihydropyrimidine dehydrogenase (NAD+) subunit PreA
MARSDAGHHVGQQTSLISQFTAAAKRAVKIPVIAKLTPNITDMIPAALAAQEGGADGVSTINTVKSISHVDIEKNVAMPTIQNHSAVSGFSGRGCRPIGLRFVSELAREQRLKIPISGMGGIYTWRDAAEYISLGASNIQATTAVMQYGVRIVEDLNDGLQKHIKALGASSVKDLVGLANSSIVEPAKLDISTEVVSVINPDLCIGCGACEIACRDGAAHAIKLAPEENLRNRRSAVVDRYACVGCKLCQHVCPVPGAITFEVRKRIDRPRFWSK